MTQSRFSRPLQKKFDFCFPSSTTKKSVELFLVLFAKQKSSSFFAKTLKILAAQMTWWKESDGCGGKKTTDSVTRDVSVTDALDAVVGSTKNVNKTCNSVGCV